MNATTTDRSPEAFERLAPRRQQAAAGYPRLFARLTEEWGVPGGEDRAWLMYAANYLLRAGGVRWAIDPLTLNWRVPAAGAVDAAQALGQLDFVLLTHRHRDHLDLDLLRALRHLPIRWVIPEFLRDEVQADAALPEGQIITPRPLQPFELCGVGILPFEGLHWEDDASRPGGRRGVPAMGYAIEFQDRRWLFPGDTRAYRPERLPSFDRLDGLFAHVWLGRGGAMLAQPPLLDDFCRFCAALHPKRVVLAHLKEFGRAADDFWDDRHARLAVERLKQIAPQISVITARMGESVPLA